MSPHSGPWPAPSFLFSPMGPVDLACLPFLHCQACACCHCVLWAEPVRPVLGGAGPGLVYSRERKTCLIRKSAGPGCSGSSSGPRWDQPPFVESTELAPAWLQSRHSHLRSHFQLAGGGGVCWPSPQGQGEGPLAWGWGLGFWLFPQYLFS